MPNDASLDTLLPNITYKVDTLTAANDMEISDDTTAATITSAGTGGNTVMFKVMRSATSETLTVPAQLIGVRIKYIKAIGAA
jgi:hypothetical protein